VTAVAIPPTLLLGGRRRERAGMLDDAEPPLREGSAADGFEPPEPGLAL